MEADAERVRAELRVVTLVEGVVAAERDLYAEALQRVLVAPTLEQAVAEARRALDWREQPAPLTPGTAPATLSG
jgi:hypothetical protein